MTKQGRAIFDAELCKGCEFCVAVCPQKIVLLTEVLNKSGYQVAGVKEMEKCTGCTMCALMCPDLVITVERGESP